MLLSRFSSPSDHPLDELLTLSCILNSNSYQVLSKATFSNMSALYLRAAMINHSCRPNTRPVVASDYAMKVRVDSCLKTNN
jgi:hypothetical protein